MIQEEGDYNVYIGREYPFTLNLKAANLLSDITISLSGTSNGQLTTSMSTIRKEGVVWGKEKNTPVSPKPHPTDWDYPTETSSFLPMA